MDVSLNETSMCIVDGSGEIVSECTVISESSAIAETIVNRHWFVTRYPRAVVDKLVRTRRSLHRGSAGNKLPCHCSESPRSP